jgi:hypothetical protein
MKKITTTALLAAAAIWSMPAAFANHPVLVEGNCDSPVPGTTIVTAGTCGDYDGDGRIGTAEDTDGADRIFGTIQAAIGAGTGAATGTGANNNGTVTIVTSGRFPEILTISSTTSGNVTLEAAPGVRATIDALLQGDPAGGNTARQAATGITIDTTASSKVVLRNLVIRNYAEGVRAVNSARVFIENCEIEHNLNYGLRAMGDSRMHISETSILSTGFRVPITGPATPGIGISYEGSARGAVVKSQMIGNFSTGLSNMSTGGGAAVIFYELMFGDNGGGAFSGPVTRYEF